MIDRLRVAVVMPMYNEARHIAATVRGVPTFVDEIVVVDDGSVDGSASALKAVADRRVRLVAHPHRQGVGVALATGLRASIELGSDLIVTMDSDGQMCPGDLPRVLAPLMRGDATYVKGDRFAPGISRRAMPPMRRAMNRLSSAYFRRVLIEPGLRDVHCGYTAMTAATARGLVAQGFHDSYGVYNDILSRVLAMSNSRVSYVPVAALYGAEQSHLRLRDVLRLSALACRIAFRRVRRSGVTFPYFVPARSKGHVRTVAGRESQQAA